MLTCKRTFLMAIGLLMIQGCTTQPTQTATTPTPGKSSKSKPKRYLDIPMDTAVSSGIRFPRSARSLDQVLDAFAPAAIEQLEPWFKKAGVSYPPNEIVMIAIKDEKKLELWARDTGPFKMVRHYDIKAASGMRGPKLKQGDRQVPEGIYHISRLNPNSNYHLSMKVDYPNQFDRDHAMDDGRTDLGGDIFIHGKAVSAGCLAMGDAAIEELFVLSAHVGTDNIRIIISPSDPRQRPLDTTHPSLPLWTNELYAEITREIFSVTQAKPPIRLAHTGTRHPIYRPAN
jgi:L,D-transpeptidase catalytic domain